MADTFRLRMKVGVHEFDAEGPRDEVTAQFEAWKELIQSAPSIRNPLTGAFVSETPVIEQSDGIQKVVDVTLARVFAIDTKRDIITLRIRPTGENMEADGVLVLVYGYHALRDLDDVPVTKLTNSVRLSGFGTGRMDRVVAPHVRAQLLIKTGSGKGGKYTLTNTGRARAQALVKELFERVA